MSAALLDPPLPLLAADRPERGRAGPRRQTLEQCLDSAWRRLSSDGVTECPVCHAPMRLEGTAGRCGGCGSTLT
jgi:hypothetical protein